VKVTHSYGPVFLTKHRAINPIYLILYALEKIWKATVVTFLLAGLAGIVLWRAVSIDYFLIIFKSSEYILYLTKDVLARDERTRTCCGPLKLIHWKSTKIQILILKIKIKILQFIFQKSKFTKILPKKFTNDSTLTRKLLKNGMYAS
jgi:hypothetical protein